MFERKFGCTISKDYKECFIIDDHACLRLTPAGFLKNNITYSPVGHIYSQHRLLEPHRELLLKKIKEDFKTTSICALVITPAKKITDHFFKIFIVHMLETMQTDAVQIKEYIQSFLETIFDTKASLEILKQLTIDENFTKKIIQQDKNLHQIFQNLISAKIKECLHKNIVNLDQQFANLKPTEDFSEDQIRIIQQIETHLTQEELELLQQRKVLIITANEISQDPDIRGTYYPLKNTIYIKKDKIEHSLIHEVQHSLGTDISLAHPQKYMRFVSQCKNALFQMKDMQNVIKLSHEGDTVEISEQMLKRAKYILTLYNYNNFERAGEVMGHLRQFIADIGEEKVKLILPNLFAFWQKEVLPKAHPKTSSSTKG